jgi:hypothetical protein
VKKLAALLVLGGLLLAVTGCPNTPTTKPTDRSADKNEKADQSDRTEKGRTRRGG